MRISEKCHNNKSDNPLTSCRTDGGNNQYRKTNQIEPTLRLSWNIIQTTLEQSQSCV